MSNQAQLCSATIRGLIHFPNVTEINVRSGPGTNYAISFKGKVGLSGLEIRDVQVDEEENDKDGKVYQWFQLPFPDGAVGWVRDDLLEIEGDGRQWGYAVLGQKTPAFELIRDLSLAASPVVLEDAEAEVAPAPTVDTPPTAVDSPVATSSSQPDWKTLDDIERIKKASFFITAAFEGTGYAAYNNYDAGIVSYGLIQFTLAAGSLFSVVDKYLHTSNSQTARELRSYAERIRGRDQSLRHDERLKQLLLQAANEPEMQQAQDAVATEKYWDAVVDGYITHRGLQTPLTYALLFDMGVNFGTNHGFVRKAEEELGVPPRSRPGENGITEEQLITRVAELRKASHYRQAERDNLPGLKVRGDFWVDQIAANDWGLIGDVNGNVNVNGRIIQVKNL
jgi:hypothetical protein